MVFKWFLFASFLCSGFLPILEVRVWASKPFVAKSNEPKKIPVKRPLNHAVGGYLAAGGYHSLSYFGALNPAYAIQASLGLRLFKSDLVATSDFLILLPEPFQKFRAINSYWGVGGVFAIQDEFESLLGSHNKNSRYLGVRFPAGARCDFILFDAPVEVIAEVFGGLLVTPLAPLLGFSLGMRVKF